jgi:hypothetical protein
MCFFVVADDSVHISDSALGGSNNQEITACMFTRSVSHDTIFAWWGMEA